MSIAVGNDARRPQVPIAEPLVAVSRPALPSGTLGLIPPYIRQLTWPEQRPPEPAELIELAREAHGILCLHTERIDADFLRACPNLVVVSSLGVGHDHLDLDAIARAGVVAGYTPDVLNEATADLTWALILAAARQVVPADRFVRSGGGDYPDLDLFVGQELAGATLGVVGFGRIGRAVARRARGFDMRVMYHSMERDPVPDSTWCELEEIASEADVVSIHTPITPQTRHLVSESFLRRMKPTSILVNTSRGGVVDQTALARALREGWIFGAGLDVQEVEPIALDDPLLQLPNCVVLPHIGSASATARRATAELAIANLVAGLEGRPLVRSLVPAERRAG